MKTYKFYEDPGHGWLAVKRQELIELGILNQVSEYSYVSATGQTIYLEEDCDAMLFVNAYKTKFGVEPTIVSKYQEKSNIRPLQSFKPE